MVGGREGSSDTIDAESKGFTGLPVSFVGICSFCILVCILSRVSIKWAKIVADAQTTWDEQLKPRPLEYLAWCRILE